MKTYALCLAGGIASLSLLWGNPENPTILSGTASFESPNSHMLQVTASDRAVLSWEGFSIDASETTYIHLPHQEAAILNRVTSVSPSVLAGHLQSNGQVYLINPNGIVVTSEGVISVGGFIASTLEISDDLFLLGGDVLFAGTSQESVINRGQITAWNGDVILLGYQVKNEHVLTSTQGVVGLGAGEEILLSTASDQRISVQVGLGSVSSQVGINNTGIIKAVQAELKADGSLYGLAIQHEGFVNATTTQALRGRIYLIAPEGTTHVSGNLNATSFEGAGGEIHVLGKTVIVTDSSTIEASGSAGGGDIYIGGSFQGADFSILASENTYVDSSVRIRAAATGSSGDGGRVVLWSNGSTYFYGNICADAATFGGDGGMVEVSGVQNVAFKGAVTSLAPNGAMGTLLLDPTNITINAAGPTTAIFNMAPCGADTYCGGALAAATIMISDLLAQLLLTNVIVDSSQGTGVGTGTITLSNALTVPVLSGNLTLNARTGITLNATITNNGTNTIALNSATGATGNITLAAGVGLSNTSSGSIALTAGTGVTTGAITTSTTSTLTNSGSGNMSFSARASGTAINMMGPVSHSSTGTFQVTTLQGNITSGASATMSLAAGSGAVTFNAAGTAGGASLTIAGAITSAASSNFQALASIGNISFSSGANLSFTGGSPILVQALGGNVTMTSGSMSFSGAGGSLTWSAQGTLAINGAITNYSYPGAAQFSSTAGSITANPIANMTFNSGSGNVSFFTPQGSITTNPLATILFNLGAGNLTFTAGTPSMFAGGITVGTITFNSGVGKSTTMDANGNISLRAINYGSTGNAVFTATGNISTFIGTALSWGSGGITAGSLFLNATNINAAGDFIFSSTSGNAPTALSMIAPTSITSSGFLVSSSPEDVIMQVTGPGSITVSGTVTFNAGAGSLFVTASNTAGNTALSWAPSVMNYATLSPAQFLVTSGNMVISTIVSTAGAPFTFQNTSATGTMSFTSLIFSGGAGPLIINGVGDISLATMSHTYTSIAQITSSAGSITKTASFIISGGGLTMDAFTDLTLFGSTIYGAPLALTLISQTSAITANGVMTLNTAAPLLMNTTPNGTDILIGNLVRSSTGTMTATAQRDFIVGIRANPNNYQFGSFAGTVSVSAGRDVIVNAFADMVGSISTYAQIGYHTGNVNSNLVFPLIGRDLIVQGGGLPLAYAVIGHGSALAGATGGTRTGNITFGSMMNPIGGNVSVAALLPIPALGSNQRAFAQIGHLRSTTGATVMATGNIDMSFVTGSVHVQGRNHTGCYALIGHGGDTSAQQDSYTGSIQVHSLGDITLQGGMATEAFAAIGQVAFLSGSGTVTLNSSLIEVISSSGISLTTGSGAESMIGLYAKAPAVGGLGALSATQITVQTGGANDLILLGATPSNNFNAVVIGALSYNGTVPLVAAGTASCNLTITAGENLEVTAGHGGLSPNAFALITSGIGTTGAFDVTIDVGNDAILTGGNHFAAIRSLRDLNMTVADDFQLFSNPGQGQLLAARNLNFDSGSMLLQGTLASDLSTMQTTTGTVDIVTGDAILALHSRILSASTLTADISGNLFLGSDTAISSSADYTIDVAQGLIISSGATALITSVLAGTLTVGDNIYILADPLGTAGITSGGNLTVTSTTGNIYLIGTPTLSNALISSATGFLTVNALGEIELLDSGVIRIAGGSSALSVTASMGQILLENGSQIAHAGTGTATLMASSTSVFNTSTISSAGAGLLTVTTTSGDLSIYNNSSIQNTGVGGLNALVNKTLYVESGSDGVAALAAGVGGGTLTVNALVMAGISMGNRASISASGGTLSITSTLTAFLNPFSQISMSGMTGTLVLNAGSDLIVAESSSILNNATSGTSALNVTADAVFLEGSSYGGNGSISLTAMGSITAVNTTMSTLDQITLSSGKDIVLGTTSLVSSVSDLDLNAMRNLTLLDGTMVTQTGMGAAGISCSATTGELTLQNGSSMLSSGTNGMTITVGGNALVQGGSTGNSFLSGAAALALTIGGNLDVIAAAGGNGAISSAATTMISALNVNLKGFPPQMTSAFIENSSGSLAINAVGSISLEDAAHIAITAGSGTLTVNTSSGDLRIGNDSFVEHQGSGATTGTINKTLLLMAGIDGAASLLGSTGGINMSASSIVMQGESSLNRAIISAANGPLTLVSNLETVLISHAHISLIAGIGAFQLTSQADLFAGGDTLIQNNGSGTSTITVTGVMQLFATSAGSSILQGNTGTLTITATDSIHVLGSGSNSASILSSGALSVMSNQDILLVGAPSMMGSVAINTLFGTLSVNAGRNLTAKDNAGILLTTGPGFISLQATANLSIENGASVVHSGVGSITATAGNSLLMRSGAIGDAFVSGNGSVTVSAAALVNMESASGTQSYISASGNSSVSAGTLYMFGSSIVNALGTLTVSSGSANCFESSLIELGMTSSGLLTVNTTTGDFRLSNDSHIHNLGSGGVSSSVNRTLYIENGILGTSSISVGSGGGNVQANAMVLDQGFILASQNNLTVETLATMSLNPLSGITLTGGSGTLQVTAMGDLFVMDGSSIVNGGSGLTNVNVTGVATIQAGDLGSSLVQGNTGVLTLTIGDNLHLLSDAGGAAAITSLGNVVVNSGADISLVGVDGMMLAAEIRTASGALTITANNNIFLSDQASFVIASGAGALSITTTNGDLYVQNASFIEQQGSGTVNGNIKKNVYVKAGFEGDAFIASNAGLSLMAGGDMNVEAAAMASAYLMANGNTSIGAGRLLMYGYDASFAAYITNATGAVTVSVGVIDMIDHAYIDLTGGMSTLSVKATTGNFTLANGSYVQQLGSGLLGIEVNNGTLYLEAEALGSASLLGGTGGATVSASAILMSGVSALSQAEISAAQGTLAVTTSKMLNLTPFSEIVLLGGSGPLNYTVGGNLYLGDNTLIHNFGSGSTNPAISGTTYICH